MQEGTLRAIRGGQMMDKATSRKGWEVGRRWWYCLRIDRKEGWDQARAASPLALNVTLTFFSWPPHFSPALGGAQSMASRGSLLHAVHAWGSKIVFEGEATQITQKVIVWLLSLASL